VQRRAMDGIAARRGTGGAVQRRAMDGIAARRGTGAAASAAEPGAVQRRATKREICTLIYNSCEYDSI